MSGARLDIDRRGWHEPDIRKSRAGRSMKTFFLKFFTWWNSQTFGTQFTIWRDGVFVGEDEFGNRYYRSRFAKDPALGHERRWVVYNGYADASAIPPGWYGWMHHRTASRRPRAPTSRGPGRSAHKPNGTGTGGSLSPAGSTLAAGKRPRATATTRPGRRVSDHGAGPPPRHGSATFPRHMTGGGRLAPLPPRTGCGATTTDERAQLGPFCPDPPCADRPWRVALAALAPASGRSWRSCSSGPRRPRSRARAPRRRPDSCPRPRGRRRPAPPVRPCRPIRRRPPRTTHPATAAGRFPARPSRQPRTRR